MSDLLQRDLRQRDLVPPEILRQFACLVVGVGAIGRQVAIQLAAMGSPKLILLDDDEVADVNLAVQGFRECDLGKPKVDAVADVCRELNSSILVVPLAERFRRSLSLDEVTSGMSRLAVFCCVDSMAARRSVFDSVRHRAQFFVDGRMAAETLRVIASSEPLREMHYPSTLFEDARAFPAPCTGRSTLYAASIAAGLMVCRFARDLRGQEAGGDLLFNLLSDEVIHDLDVQRGLPQGGLC